MTERRSSIRERRRRKRRQMMIRRFTRLGVCVVGVILLVVFVVRGIILPIVHRGDDGTTGGSTEVVQELGESAEDFTAEVPEASEETTESIVAEGESAENTSGESSTQAVRVPLKGAADMAKLGVVTPGWHTNADGRWYQNVDGTYYANGFQQIDGTSYSFDENGYIQTGWVSRGVKDYYFAEDGSYDPNKTRPLICLTFDDGPGDYTMELLDCLEENNAKATFLMLGECVSYHEDAVKRMVELGCEIGNHSYDHQQLTTLSLDAVVDQYQRTDDALIAACGQASTVCRAPYGDANTDIYTAVGKPFAMWSLDSLDWKLKDVELDYNEVMNGDLTDGTIILMHDIHEPSVKAAERIIPDLIAQGYKLVTFSEMAEAKNVTLQNTVYIDFWPSALESGQVAGYNGSDNSLS